MPGMLMMQANMSDVWMLRAILNLVMPHIEDVMCR